MRKRHVDMIDFFLGGAKCDDKGMALISLATVQRRDGLRPIVEIGITHLPQVSNPRQHELDPWPIINKMDPHHVRIKEHIGILGQKFCSDNFEFGKSIYHEGDEAVTFIMNYCEDNLYNQKVLLVGHGIAEAMERDENHLGWIFADSGKVARIVDTQIMAREVGIVSEKHPISFEDLLGKFEVKEKYLINIGNHAAYVILVSILINFNEKLRQLNKHVSSTEGKTVWPESLWNWQTKLTSWKLWMNRRTPPRVEWTLFCTNCKSNAHTKNLCPHFTPCMNCKSTTHARNTCPQIPPCTFCRSFTHSQGGCPHLPPCTKCGSAEHTIYDCGGKEHNAYKEGIILWCETCGAFGHITKFCPQTSTLPDSFYDSDREVFLEEDLEIESRDAEPMDLLPSCAKCLASDDPDIREVAWSHTTEECRGDQMDLDAEDVEQRKVEPKHVEQSEAKAQDIDSMKGDSQAKAQEPEPKDVQPQDVKLKAVETKGAEEKGVQPAPVEPKGVDISAAERKSLEPSGIKPKNVELKQAETSPGDDLMYVYKSHTTLPSKSLLRSRQEAIPQAGEQDVKPQAEKQEAKIFCQKCAVKDRHLRSDATSHKTEDCLGA